MAEMTPLSMLLLKFSQQGGSNLADVLAVIPDHQHTCPACREEYTCSDEDCREEEFIYERRCYPEGI